MEAKAMYVRLDGLKFYARHGVMHQETCVGAEFTVDLRLATDFSKAAETDVLEGTINYADVFEKVKEEMNRPSRLLEHVAYRIAQRLLADFPSLHAVDICLYKQNPPMGADCRQIGIEVTYSR